MAAAQTLLLLAALLGWTTAAELVCFYDSLASTRPGAGRVTVTDLNKDMCTKYVYQHASFRPENLNFRDLNNFGVDVNSQEIDITNEGYETFVAMKSSRLKTLLAIGGYDALGRLGALFDFMIKNPTTYSGFVTSAVAFTRQHGFDGIDMYYPQPQKENRDNFVTWAREMKQALQQQNLLFTITITSGITFLRDGLDFPGISAHFDLINVQTFDFDRPPSNIADHHAPFVRRYLCGGPRDIANVQDVMFSILNAGAQRSKLVVGIPAFGRTWSVSGENKEPPVQSGGPGPTDGIPGARGPYTDRFAFLSYLEICENIASGWTSVEDPRQRIGPYAYSGEQWVGYDDPTMVATKTKWVVEQEFAGVMISDVSLEDTRNTCGDGTWPLLSAAYNNLGLSTTEIVGSVVVEEGGNVEGTIQLG